MIQNLEQYIEINEFFFKPQSGVAPHCCLWGDFNFSLDGILQIKIEDEIYITPPNYGIWIPPHVEHYCVQIDCKLNHCICIRLHPSLSEKISKKVKTLVTEPFFHELVKEALKQKSNSKAYQHLLQVIYDQLCSADSYDQYLPKTNHEVLIPVLKEVGDSTKFDIATSVLIDQFKISERHLFRLCQEELKMSLNEWRNRAKILFAVAQLQNGKNIKTVSYQLGYQHSSSFIDFFKKYTCKTPSQVQKKPA